MLELPDIHAIQTMHRREIPKWQIPRTLGVSQRTVDKYTVTGFLVEASPGVPDAGVLPLPLKHRG